MSTVTRREPEALEPKRLRRVLVGRPMQSGQIHETLLPKWLALPIFASDPLSSVAYATESALVVLVAASAASAYLVFPISIGIACLLGIVIISYRQTVRVYETSGGAYVVARENLGTTPSLVAAAALLTDYVLTVAVSISAGIYAITSFVPSLTSHKVGLSLVCLVLIVLANLRGVRESGMLFALPTYAFVTSILVLVAVGLFQDATGNLQHAVVPNALPTGTGVITIFVLLRAFSSGSTALTGVEAIANGVNAFRHPQGKNAAKTLAVLGTIAITMFIGVSFLAVHVHAMPSSTDSVVSQIARTVFPPGSFGAFMYYAVQGTTLLVLVLAANTSFQGFPRLSALLARDRFAPRQFSNLGDRLVFSNGMLVLAAAAAALLVIYKANTNSLIHLYVIGVFTAFTLSQAGMVRYWRRVRTPGWRRRALVNVVGASATGLVTLIVIWTKFGEGAWLVTIAIPVLVVAMLGVRRHYTRVGRRLSAGAAAVAAAPGARNRTLLVVEDLDPAAERALAFARKISPDGFRAIHVPRHGSDPGIGPRWFHFSDGEAAARKPRPARRNGRRGARAGLAAAARRVGLRHGRRPGAVPPPRAHGGSAASLRVRSEAPAPDRAGCRRRRRADGGREPERSPACRPDLRLRGQRSLDAGSELGRGHRPAGHAGCQLRLRRGRGRRDATQVEGGGCAGAARGACSAVPGHRRPASRLPARAHERGG